MANEQDMLPVVGSFYLLLLSMLNTMPVFHGAFLTNGCMDSSLAGDCCLSTVRQQGCDFEYLFSAREVSEV